MTVECAVCAREIPDEDALLAVVEGESLAFCSEACRETGLQEGPPAPIRELEMDEGPA
jgi:endogenous inhibitor of DNA gyrase (YacG/DUF329 family)